MNNLNLESNIKDIEVSVIIPFFSNKYWLIEALESVKAQTLKGYEVIIINDGSKEDISDLESNYKDFNFYKISNSGPGVARNIGIEKAVGNYIAFLDSDDLWKPTKLESQIQFMKENEFVWSHTSYIQFRDKNEIIKKVRTDFHGQIIPDILISCPIATPCIIIKRQILLENSEMRFSEKTRVGEDSYFWFKIAEGFPLGFLDEYLTLVRIRNNNAAYQALLQLKSKADAYFFVKNSSNIFKSKTYFTLMKFGYFMCYWFYSFLKKISKAFSLDAKSQEFFSKILYLLPYLYLKTILIIYKNK